MKKEKLLALQSSQPLLRILNFSNTRVSVFPEVEEFLMILYGFRVSILFLRLADYFVTGRPIFRSSS